MKIAIIGGGASGLACAVSALRKAEKTNIRATVTVFEAKDRVGKKILATGNGRCNMLNTSENPFFFSADNFHSFAINKFNAESDIDFFASMGLYTRTDEEGRVYPLSNQAASVLECLRNECGRLGVEFKTDCTVTSVDKNKNSFIINSEYAFDKVVLACGGKASVKSFNGYELLASLGHKITGIYPSLSKLNTKNTNDVKQLQGIRHKVRLSLFESDKFVCEEKGEILFAKYGISGIAVMQMSAYITRKKGSWKVVGDFIPDFTAEFISDAIKNIALSNPHLSCGSLLIGFMPGKLGEVVIKSCGIDLKRAVASLSSQEISRIVRKSKKYIFDIDSVRPFEDAQVTAGGADTAYFDSRTMESKICKGFYAIGEVLDVDGLCGGYNLMWAWSSGRLCGESLLDER